MAAKPRVSFATTTRGTAPSTVPVVETSSTRRRIQDVLGQARAALRQSQQFRHIPADSKDNNLSNKLQFQQQPQDDYWSSPGAGGVMSATTAEKERHARSTQNYDNEDSRSTDNFRQLQKKDDFGTPFHDAMRKTPVVASTRAPSQHKKLSGGLGSAEPITSDASTTSISMSTNDLRPDSEEYSSSEDSQVDGNSQHESVKRSLKSATTKSSKREMKLKEWEVPSTVKLTPLNSAVTSVIAAEAFGDIGPPELNVEIGGQDEDEINTVPLPRRPIQSGHSTGKVEVDDMGFSRATITQHDEDPNWFEKALLARGETISEAAYKAFKQAQSIQLKQQTEETIDKGMSMAVKKIKGKQIINDLTDPEYTADWISDGGMNSSMLSEVDIPASDYIKEEEVELDIIGDDDEELNTESMIRTATELEQSGVLDEIAENLQSVLDISERPESQNFSGMSAEEKTFAREYDEAMLDADEPLQSIFLDEAPGSSGSENRKTTPSLSGTAGQDENNTSSQRRHTLTKDEQDDFDYDDNTFIQVDSTASSFTKSMSKRRSSSKSIQQTSRTTSTLMSAAGKNKKSTSSVNNTASGTVKSSKSLKIKTVTSGSGGSSSKTTSDKSKSVIKSKSYASTSSSTSKRLNSLPIPPDPPTSRHQKNIQTLLEKEVYQKELRRIRSEKIREENNQEKLQKIAKASLERNMKTTWKDPDYTEILLPELFKYKSVSGLQAAKARRSILTPSMNYGAPYFQLNGAISATEGTESILAAAKVESLDIPDLVREVLASNERMYKMTVEASEQMAKKAYKDKVRKEMKRHVNIK